MKGQTMKKLITICIVAGLLFAIGTQVANASIITSSSDPALSGATVIDFEGQTKGLYTSLAIGDVTFIANDNHLGIDNYWNYGTQGIYLDNGTYENQGFSSMTIMFGTTADAFGFNWGAAEPWSNWSLSAYNASNNLLDSYSPLPNTGPSTTGAFVGLAVNGIDHATLSTSTAYDWIFVDNFAYTGGQNVIPAPGAILLGSIGVALVGWLRRRRTL
jgi:hypothetical protein